MVARIILVGNEKGGVGKTTIAVNLASIATAKGIDTILVDCDGRQNSAGRWRGAERTFIPIRPIFGLES